RRSSQAGLGRGCWIRRLLALTTGRWLKACWRLSGGWLIRVRREPAPGALQTFSRNRFSVRKPTRSGREHLCGAGKRLPSSPRCCLEVTTTYRRRHFSCAGRYEMPSLEGTALVGGVGGSGDGWGEGLLGG